jgi:glycosyltransferase involved in cell wall biosynthesis
MAKETEAWLRPGVVSCIHNGIDVDRCRPLRPRDAVREELGIGSEAPVLIAAGRLVPVKGLDQLLAALPGVRETLPLVQVLIVGDGPERSRLEQQANELGVSSAVRFCGHRQDIYDLVAASDVLVLPSFAEGLPMVILEAMALGTPIVASQVGGLPEVLRDGQSALLVPPGSPVALGQACARLLSRRDEARAMARAARQVVETQFTSLTQAEKVLDLYRGLAA